MSVGDTVTGAVAKATLPWLGSVGLPWILLACVMALGGTGAAGMYLGIQISDGRHAQDTQALKDAQIEALSARNEQYLNAVARGDEVSEKFFAALRDIKIENKTFNNEVVREIEKQVYIDCKVPESGVELLRKRIEAANARIASKQGVAP